VNWHDYMLRNSNKIAQRSKMPKRCPRGFVCTDWSSVTLGVAIIVAVLAAVWYWSSTNTKGPSGHKDPGPAVVVVSAPPAAGMTYNQQIRPDLYPEPVRRLPFGLPSLGVRGPAGSYEQIGILTGEGGSSSSAAPDRTILPLYGRELDARRGKWNYYTRTDGANPVQVPVRVRNRVCDDDTVGCEEVYSDDSVHVPALGRSFKATVYTKSLFR
jgi:hypothetical protein